MLLGFIVLAWLLLVPVLGLAWALTRSLLLDHRIARAEHRAVRKRPLSVTVAEL